MLQYQMSAEKLHIEDDWRQPDLLAQRRGQLSSGAYSAVILGRQHYNLLFGLLGMTLQQVLSQFGHQVLVHVLDLDGESPPPSLKRF